MKKLLLIRIVEILVLLVPLLLLCFRLGSFPPTVFNWESYTVWHIFGDTVPSSISIFSQPYRGTLDGLMTESGLTLPLNIPIRIFAKWFGLSLWSLRLWPMLLTFSGFLLYYFWSKRVFGRSIAIFAALFFGTSQAFLVYGRTATIVGPTLLMEMASVFIIWHGLTKKPRLWLALSALVAIYSNYFFYGPIRIVTPILILVVIRWLYFTISRLLRRFIKQKKVIHKIEIACIVALTIVAGLSLFYSKNTIIKYYNSRGEQVMQLTKTTEFAKNPTKTLTVYLQRNLIHYAGLITAYDSKPTLESFNDHFGQILHRVFVPFFFIGICISGAQLLQKKSKKHAFLLLWYALFSLPILFTSNVHVGRLFLSLAPQYIITAIGVGAITKFLLKTFEKYFTPKLYWQIAVGGIVLSLSVSVVTSEAIHYFNSGIALDHNVKVLMAATQSWQRKQVFLINFEPTSLHYWDALMYLQTYIQFEDYQSKRPIRIFRYSGQEVRGYLVQNRDELNPDQCQIGSQDYAISVGYYRPPNSTATNGQSTNRCLLPHLQLYNR